MKHDHYLFNRFNIENEEYLKMPILFTGMMFSGKSPTDIDASMDFDGKFFIFYEIKTNKGEISRGQARHLYELTKGLIAGGRKAAALVVDYEGKPSEGIPLAECRLRMGCGSDFERLKHGMTAVEATLKLLKIWGAIND